MHHLLLWASLALGANPPSTPGLSTGAEAAASCGSRAELIEKIRIAEDKDAWLCLSRDDEGGPSLLAALAAGGPGGDRLTRGLALWSMARLDQRISDEEARALSPADRRLLRDAIQARRGRASPAPDHAAIFAWFSWYKPDSHYTVARLSELDQQNMALLDKPPPKPPPTPPAAEAMKEAAAELPAAQPEEGVCGCASVGGATGGLGALLIVAVAAARRRGARATSS